MNKYIQGALITTLVAMGVPSHAQGFALPQDISRQIPVGYTVMTSKSSDFNGDGKVDYVVVVRSKKEAELLAHGSPTPNRPLLVFIQEQAGKFLLESRNNEVVFAADAGGQCDPFMDGEDGLAVKGSFFTVQNAVACGEHWTDFITFRYSTELRQFVFHKRIFESMTFNSSSEPEAEAITPGRRLVTKAKKSNPILLSAYRPNM